MEFQSIVINFVDETGGVGNCMLKNIHVFIVLMFTLLCNNHVLAQSNDAFSFKTLNGEGVNAEELNVWTVNSGKLELDSMNKYEGTHSFKLTPTRLSKDSVLKSEIVYSLPAYMLENDRTFYKLQGDSLELKGFFSCKDARNAELTITVCQESASESTFEQSFTLSKIDGNLEWQPFHVKTPILESTNIYSFKLATNGNIAVWYDNLEMKIDGDDMGNKWNIYFPADKDLEFEKGSNLSITEGSLLNFKNMELLAKIWGFMKYYHPDVAKGDYQWDYELFRVVEKIVFAQTKEQRNSRFLEWITKNKLEVVAPNDQSVLDTSVFYSTSDLSWINDKQDLGAELVAELNNIKNAKRDNWIYYIQLDSSMFELYPVNFVTEKQYASISWQDQGYRLLTLFRYWNVINYCYPYFKDMNVNWDKVLAKYLPRFLWVNSEMDYQNAILALIAELNDSHAWIRSSDPYMFAAIFEEAGDDVVVKKSYSCQLRAGDVLLKMNGKDIDEVLKERGQFVSASNDSRRKNMVVSDLNKWDSNNMSALCLRGEDTLSVKLSDFNLVKAMPECISEIKPCDYSGQLAENDIVYLSLATMDADLLIQMEDRIMHSEGVIIDCRCYPTSDSFYDKLSDLFLPYPSPYMALTRLDLQTPGTFRLDGEYKIGRENPTAYKGKVVILVNSHTQSAAETVVMTCQNIPGSITLGSQSSGANGGTMLFSLPGGFDTNFTGEGCYYPTGRAVQRIGVKLDLTVRPTRDGVLQGRDEQLEKAIDLIKNEADGKCH